MIKTKKELRFYIAADRIMNGAPKHWSVRDFVNGLVKPNYILDYLRHMRCVAYYKQHNTLLYLWHYWFYHRLGVKLGFSISADSFGYGLVIPHHGTIVISSDVSAGNYCVLHTSTCIGGGE